jgi:hypothetical protein
VLTASVVLEIEVPSKPSQGRGRPELFVVAGLNAANDAAAGHAAGDRRAESACRGVKISRKPTLPPI